MRGQRVLGAAAFVSTALALVGSQLYPVLSARLGQPALLMWAGVLEVIVCAALLLLPRRGPAGYGIVVAEHVADEGLGV